MGKYETNYQKWERDALEEFKNSEYWEDEYEQGTLDITSDGDVYLGNLSWIKNAVTSWKDSKYYVE